MQGISKPYQKPANKEYKQKKPKKQDAFYESHRCELTLYESAEHYLKGVMNGKTALPIKAWKSEQAKLTAEKKALYQEYYSLKKEVQEVEKIRRDVYDIMREETRTTQRTRAQDMEL